MNRNIIFFLIAWVISFISIFTATSYATTTPQIGVGNDHTIALKSDGTVWAWGWNEQGQLGDGTTDNKKTPVQVSELSSIITIAVGGYHNLAIKSDGTVWAWGYNLHGQLGNGRTYEYATAPIQVSGLDNVIAIACGDDHSLALRSDGSVWAWGSNYHGQLGDGTFEDRTMPIEVENITDVVAIAAGSEVSFALKSDGNVWAWGFNYYGQLGLGYKTISQNVPTQINGLNNIITIASRGRHSFAIKSDSTVWGWGVNDGGQLGDGTISNKTLPVKISELSNFNFITCEDSYSLAIKSDGTVWAWGWNIHSNLGDDEHIRETTPMQVRKLNDIVHVAGGGNNGHSHALKSDGTVWSWGYNWHGELGCGTYAEYYRTEPVQTHINLFQSGTPLPMPTPELNEKGKIYGYVKNLKEEPIESARVRLRWGTTISPNKKIALTETDGLYAFTKLEAGTYNIIARKKGYKRSDGEERYLSKGEGTEVYFKLKEKITKTSIQRQ